MKNMKRYCIGFSTLWIRLFIGIVLIGNIVVCFKNGYGIFDVFRALFLLIKFYLTHYYIVFILLVIFLETIGTPTTRYYKCIRKFQRMGKLEEVLNEFNNPVFVFHGESAKIGQKFIFIRDTGRIFSLDEVSAYRMMVDRYKYESGRSEPNRSYLQIKVGKKYYDICYLPKNFSDPQWIKFNQIVTAYAPHIALKTMPKVIETYIDDIHKRSDSNFDD